jgi:hypothetical protein
MYFTFVETEYEGPYESAFPTLEKALEWINSHMSDGYVGHRIIEGREIKLEPAEVVTKFKVKQ